MCGTRGPGPALFAYVALRFRMRRFLMIRPWNKETDLMIKHTLTAAALVAVLATPALAQTNQPNTDNQQPGIAAERSMPPLSSSDRGAFVPGRRAFHTTHRPAGYPNRDVALLHARHGQLA